MSFLSRKIEILEQEVRQLVAKQGHCDPTVPGNHEQICKECKIPLAVLWDYAGGGSHYYHLMCNRCNAEYYYDNYSKKLIYT